MKKALVTGGCGFIGSNFVINQILSQNNTVLNFDNLKILFPILESQTFKDFEIIFIDSGSTDGSFEFVQKYKSEIPIILEEIHKSMFSFGRSLNMAANKSRYKDKLISKPNINFTKSPTLMVFR